MVFILVQKSPAPTFENSPALRDFWAVYDEHYAQIHAASMAEVHEHPEFAALVARLSREQQEAQSVLSRERLRRAILEGAWAPYEEDLRTQGAAYAKLGISISGWYDIIGLFQTHIVPRLVEKLGATPRLTAALTAMQQFVNRTMIVIGQQYIDAKQAALLASQAESMRAHEATRAKSDFLAMMSHELRTPLNSIIGFSEVLIDQQMGELNSRQQRYVKNISESGHHLLHLINDLLDLSKIEAGRLDVSVESCNARSLVDEVLTTVRPIADRRKVTLVLDGVGVGLATIRADPVRLKQVFYNLLSNAIKFSPPESEVYVDVRVGKERVHVSVRDFGIGIAADDVARLFNPFTQLKGRQRAEGTGLGLAVSKQLIELMGGSIGVTSQVGHGSTFFVELRTSAEVAAPISPISEAPRGLALIVDDDPAARELIELILREEGFRTLHAASGEEGLALAREHRPDVVTLDVLLPGVDGWEALRRLREDPITRDGTVIMVSVSSDRHTALTLGAIEHLVKPIDRPTLISVLERRGLLTAAKARTCYVLVIDDDPKHLELVTSSLEAPRFAVLTAATGRAGLELAMKHPVDVLLLDLVLPDISGVEVARALRADSRTRGLPILLVTAHELSPADRLRLTGEVQAVLAKGELGVEGLREQIHRVLMARIP